MEHITFLLCSLDFIPRIALAQTNRHLQAGPSVASIRVTAGLGKSRNGQFQLPLVDTAHLEIEMRRLNAASFQMAG